MYCLCIWRLVGCYYFAVFIFVVITFSTLSISFLFVFCICFVAKLFYFIQDQILITHSPCHPYWTASADKYNQSVTTNMSYIESEITQIIYTWKVLWNICDLRTNLRKALLQEIRHPTTVFGDILLFYCYCWRYYNL